MSLPKAFGKLETNKVSFFLQNLVSKLSALVRRGSRPLTTENDIGLSE